MARYGVNKVILIGNLGADPEIRHTRDNVAVANLRLATTERYRDRSEERRGGDQGAGRAPQEQGRGGQWQDRTEWHNVVLWRALAETAERYLRKGSSVYIEGRLETRSWEDKSGQKRYTTEVVARDMIMLGGRGEGAAAGDEAAMPPPPDADDGPAPARPGSDAGQDDDLPF